MEARVASWEDMVEKVEGREDEDGEREK